MLWIMILLAVGWIILSSLSRIFLMLNLCNLHISLRKSKKIHYTPTHTHQNYSQPYSSNQCVEERAFLPYFYSPVVLLYYSAVKPLSKLLTLSKCWKRSVMYNRFWINLLSKWSRLIFCVWTAWFFFQVF